jgi:hypothetical protein
MKIIDLTFAEENKMTQPKNFRKTVFPPSLNSLLEKLNLLVVILSVGLKRPGFVSALRC